VQINNKENIRLTKLPSFHEQKKKDTNVEELEIIGEIFLIFIEFL